MTQDKASRKSVYLTDNLIVDGWLFDGGYFLSGTDVGNVIEKHHYSIRVFLESKASEHLPDKDRNPLVLNNFEGRGSRITLYTTACVREYWAYWAFAGNLKAQTIVKILMGDSLERIFDEIFREEPKSKEEYQQNRTLIEHLIRARDICKAYHPGFQLRCKRNHYPACRVHNRMTLLICGMNADMARQLKAILVLDSDVGLDHYQLKHELALRQLAVAKRIFTGMRTPNLMWQQQVTIAVNRAQKEVPV